MISQTSARVKRSTNSSGDELGRPKATGYPAVEDVPTRPEKPPMTADEQAQESGLRRGPEESGLGRPFVLLFTVIVFVETVRDIRCDGWRFRLGNWLAICSH